MKFSGFLPIYGISLGIMGVHTKCSPELSRWIETMTASNPKRSPKLVAVLIGLAVIAAACAGSSSDDVISLSDGGLAVPTPEVTEVDEPAGDAVDFSYVTFEGEELNFAEFADGPVVLNFFASWCPTCIAELPDFEAVSQQLDGDVTFLGLATQDRAEASDELIENTGVTFDVGRDPDGAIFSIFQGLGMPTTVFINADGTVADVHTGVLNFESLTDAINEELL